MCALEVFVICILCTFGLPQTFCTCDVNILLYIERRLLNHRFSHFKVGGNPENCEKRFMPNHIMYNYMAIHRFMRINMVITRPTMIRNKNQWLLLEKI